MATFTFSEEIQRGIILLLKTDRTFYSDIRQLMKASYFEYPIHKALFQMICEYQDKYNKLPTDTIIMELARERLPSDTTLNGISVSDVQDELVLVGRVKTEQEHSEFLLDLIEKFAKRRAMIEAIEISLALIKEDKVEEVEDHDRRALTVSRTVDLGTEYYGTWLQRWAINMSDRSDKFMTILPSINKTIEGGTDRKEIAMVVAPPGVGKSLYLVNQGVRALTENRSVLYISLEMSEKKIAQRFDSVMTLIPQDKLKTEQVKLKDRLALFQEKFPKSKLMIKEFGSCQITINHIRALLTQLAIHEDFIPELIIVDYLELMEPTREGMAEYQAQQRIAQELRGLAVEYGVMLWTATQTNRAGQEVPIITDVHLADSYGKIRTVDLAISLNQDAEEFDQGVMRGYVIKNRNGRARFLIPMTISYKTLSMAEITEGNGEEED